jgi:hypothetical protein
MASGAGISEHQNRVIDDSPKTIESLFSMLSHICLEIMLAGIMGEVRDFPFAGKKTSSYFGLRGGDLIMVNVTLVSNGLIQGDRHFVGEYPCQFLFSALPSPCHETRTLDHQAEAQYKGTGTL